MFELFAYCNPLHPDIFPAVRKMEAEVVRMCCNMFNGPRTSCGTVRVTSTILAQRPVCADDYRWHRIDSNGNARLPQPRLLEGHRTAGDVRVAGEKCPSKALSCSIIPNTAHAAFHKAAHYFRMRVRMCRVDDDTRAASTWHMSSLINRNTCCLVGSAPCFAYGTIDPLDEISRLGARYNIPVHVDACLGGFLLPHMELLGYNVPQFDFRLPGVTSISCDMHKVG